jgi:hypothetical protein
MQDSVGSGQPTWCRLRAVIATANRYLDRLVVDSRGELGDRAIVVDPEPCSSAVPNPGAPIRNTEQGIRHRPTAGVSFFAIQPH